MITVVVDTNVLVYAVDEDSQFFRSSRQFLENESIKFVTTSKNLVEFLSVVTKKSGYNLSPTVAIELLNQVSLKFIIIYPTRQSLNLLTQLVLDLKPNGLKIHDYEIVSIAKSAGINTIASFNSKDFAGIDRLDLYPIN